MLQGQQERQRALQAYDILHSAREKLFDDLVELAAYIFSVPVARIAFVGAAEVWHKASVGMPAQESMGPEHTLCSRAVLAETPVLVFQDLPAGQATAATRERRVRFYAGAPVCTTQGLAIGTVCLAGYEPRQFSPAEQQVLRQLAALVMQALEARQETRTRAGEQAWEHRREAAEAALHNQMAVVRYLKARGAGQVPVPPDLLEPIAKRLEEVAEALRQPAP
ncbi:GAF domain-containing protein [Hymenobacter luteus]|uniref:GAF domain-containing protein n=2 Tax=Hymenobacter TaxID=89966 RepID=A0A7W9T4V6_9BACT|nr:MULTISPECIES: GAF domain-containing protein [Hymenobacter]MBB4602962.1 GAF domain-containing protein [Hymenobacter latericoloratus]MBB6060854.1 GAF domain-containing protein [Hymenobacter luteus]